MVQAALIEAGLPAGAVQLVKTTDRAAVGHLVRCRSTSIWSCRAVASLIGASPSRPASRYQAPHGNCHVYVDAKVDPTGRRRDHQRQDAAGARATRPNRCCSMRARRRPSCRTCAVFAARAWRSAAATGGNGPARLPGAHLVRHRRRLVRGVPRPIISVKVVTRWTKPSSTSTVTARTTPMRS